MKRKSTPNDRDLSRRAAIYADKMMVILRARTLGRSTARPARSRAEAATRLYFF
jgi:hypothetical protein